MTTDRPRARLLMARDTAAELFDPRRLDRLHGLVDLEGEPVLEELREPRPGVEVLVTSWGAPRLTAERLDLLPDLLAVFHCAGSVRGLVSDEFWRRDLFITTAADANAVPVAEFTFAAIVLANKGAFTAIRALSGPVEGAAPHSSAGAGWSFPAHGGGHRLGNLGRRIGVVGFSRIGRRVVRMLGTLDDTEIIVADPYAEPGEVATAGARLADLPDLLAHVDVLTLHAPALPSTRHLIGARELALLPDGATLVNTARGALVDHDALLAECRSGRLRAVLDVTDPEPLPPGSELLRLPNVAVTPHLAGSLGTEIRRLADAGLDDLEAWLRDGTAPHRLTALDFGTTA